MREDDGRAGKGRQEKRKTWAGQFLIHPPTSRSPAPGGPYVNKKDEEDEDEHEEEKETAQETKKPEEDRT